MIFDGPQRLGLQQDTATGEILYISGRGVVSPAGTWEKA